MAHQHIKTWIGLIFAVTMAGRWAEASTTFYVEPIRASGVEGVDWIAGPGPTEMTLFRGDQFLQTKVYFEDFQFDPDFALYGVSMTMDCDSLDSGTQGMAEPIENMDCAVVGQGTFGVDFCQGVDSDDPDYIFLDDPCSLPLSSSATCPGGYLQFTGYPVLVCGSMVDTGDYYYGTHLAYYMTPDAEGTFTLGLFNDPSDDNTTTVVGEINTGFATDPDVTIIPATITMGTGACCGEGIGVFGCADTASDVCAQLGGVFNPLASCAGSDADSDGVDDVCDICAQGSDVVDTDADGTPDACDACPFDNPDDGNNDGIPDCVVGVPTAGGWGLMALALSLLVLVKLYMPAQRPV